MLQVKESTLRKLLLEECGYKFDRNDQKQRWYSDKDVIAFMIFLLKTMDYKIVQFRMHLKRKLRIKVLH